MSASFPGGGGGPLGRATTPGLVGVGRGWLARSLGGGGGGGAAPPRLGRLLLLILLELFDWAKFQQRDRRRPGPLMPSAA